MIFKSFFKITLSTLIVVLIAHQMMAQCAITVENCPLESDPEMVALQRVSSTPIASIVSSIDTVIATSQKVSMDGTNCPFYENNTDTPSSLIITDTVLNIYPFAELVDGSPTFLELDGASFPIKSGATHLTDVSQDLSTSTITYNGGDGATVEVMGDTQIKDSLVFTIPEKDQDIGFKFTDAYGGTQELYVFFATSHNGYKFRVKNSASVGHVFLNGTSALSFLGASGKFTFIMDYPSVHWYVTFSNGNRLFLNTINFIRGTSTSTTQNVIYERPAAAQAGTYDRTNQFCTDCTNDYTITGAKFNAPTTIISDGNDGLLICDGGAFPSGHVRKMDANGVLSVFNEFNYVQSIVRLQDGSYLASEYGEAKIYAISADGSTRSVFAGGGGSNSWPAGSGWVDGTGTAAAFYIPRQLALLSNGDVVVADDYNNRVRKITPAGVVTTIGGAASSGLINGNHNSTQTRFKKPAGVCVDANDNVYVADQGNDVIRKIAPDGEITTFASIPSSVLGEMIMDDTGNIYVTDYPAKIYKVTPTGVVSVYAGSTQGNQVGTTTLMDSPKGLYLDADGTLWVADNGNDKIIKVFSDGSSELVAGYKSSSGSWSNGTTSNSITCDVNYNVTSEDFTRTDGATFQTLTIHTSALDVQNDIDVQVIDATDGTVKTTKGLSSGENIIDISPLGLTDLRLNFLFDNAGNTAETACVDSYNLDYL